MSSEKNNKQQHSTWMVLITVMVGTLLIGIDRTIVNLGLPGMINDFSITVSAAGWIATAYIISNAVFVPVFGKLGDKVGNKIIYFWSFIGFIVVSVFAGLSWNLSSMIFFRIIQGLVGAAIYPTAMALIARNFSDKKQRTQALGLWSASFAVSAVLGPLIGGPLIDNFSWRWLFYINLPIGIVGLIMTILYLPSDKPVDTEKGFDYKGAGALAIALSSLVTVLEKGYDWGWTSWSSLSLFATMILFLVIFYFIEKKAKDPIIDLKLFKNNIYVKILILSFVSFCSMMGATFLLPVFAQTYLDFNATKTGLLFVPMAMTMFVAAPLGGYLSNIIKLRYLVSFGISISALGIYMFSGLDVKTTAAELIFPLIIFALGMGLSLAPMTATATNSVPVNEVGVSSALLNLVRNISGAIGIALFSTLLSNKIESSVIQVGQDAVVNTTNPQTLQLIDTLIVLKAQVIAYGDVFVIAAFVMASGILFSVFLQQPPKDHSVSAVKS